MDELTWRASTPPPTEPVLPMFEHDPWESDWPAFEDEHERDPSPPSALPGCVAAIGFVAGCAALGGTFLAGLVTILRWVAHRL